VTPPAYLSSSDSNRENSSFVGERRHSLFARTLCYWCQSHTSAEESIINFMADIKTVMSDNGWARAEICCQIPLAPGTWWESHTWPIVEHTRRHRSVFFDGPRWLCRFKEGSTSCEYTERPGRPMVVIGDTLPKFLGRYPFAST
jgi:hypothetical protein